MLCKYLGHSFLRRWANFTIDPNCMYPGRDIVTIAGHSTGHSRCRYL